MPLTVSSAERLLESGHLDELISRNNKPTAGKSATNNGFADMLKNSINEVNQLQVDADKKITDFAVGENKNINETMMAVEQANISFRLMVQVRNKILEAYNEIMKMQI